MNVSKLLPSELGKDEMKQFMSFRDIIYIKKSLDRNKTDDIFKEILSK